MRIIAKLIFITGGARSGKSYFSEELAKDIGKDVTYIATALPIDEEMNDRIKEHQNRRPQGWKLIEAYRNLNFSKIKEYSVILLDCLTIMTTNLLYDHLGDFSRLDSIDYHDFQELKIVENKLNEEYQYLLSLIKKFKGTVIIVSNEIGLGLVPETLSNRYFRDVLGRANKLFASKANEVYFCLSGIPVKIKG